MLIATLRNIGIAELGDKGELEILLDEQWSQLKGKIKDIINCKVNLQTGEFELEKEEFSKDKVSLFLPGLTKGNSKNYSPFSRLKLDPPKNKDFISMDPNQLINFNKIFDYNDFIGVLTDELVIKFGQWLEENREQLLEVLHKYFIDNHLKPDKKGRLVVEKNAPSFIGFSIVINGREKKIGELKGFRELYLLQKEKNEKTSKIIEDLVCIACGKHKSDLKSLENCKFFELFSLDQMYFKFNFRDDTSQAMICSECENLVRTAYTLVNEVLKFEAYNVKISEKKRKYVYHSILPLTEDPKKIKTFIEEIRRYRKKHYDSKKEAVIQKLSELQQAIDRVDKKIKKNLRNELRRLEKEKKELEEKGLIGSTMDLDYFTILREAEKRKIGLLDFYYTEESTGGQTKKIVIDLIYGDKQRIEKIVQWVYQTSKEFGDAKYQFQLKKLITCFGEKMGKYVFQSLFSGKKLKERDLYRSAYKSLWPIFKEHINQKEQQNYTKINIVRDGVKTLHFTLALLERANLIRR